MDTNDTPFPFLKLPSELRNKIYELLLTNLRDPHILGRTIHCNDLARRVTRRYKAAIPVGLLSRPIPAHSTGLSKKSKALAAQHHFLNDTAATQTRLAHRLSTSGTAAPLLEVAILRACKQTYREGTHILYTLNTFAVMVREPRFHHPQFTQIAAQSLRDMLPATGLQLDRIRHLRIELQLGDAKDFRQPVFRPRTWAALCEMRDLKSLRIVVSFRGYDGYGHALIKSKELFDRCWQIVPAYEAAIRDLVGSVPKDVEMLWGLTKTEKAFGDYGGMAVAKGCVLRKMGSKFAWLQETDMDAGVERPLDAGSVGHLPVDGEGEDGDEEGDGDAK